MAREVGSVSSDCFCGRFGSEDGKVIHLIDLQRKDLHRSSYREETGQTSKICRKVSNFWAPCPTLERKTVRVLSQCTSRHNLQTLIADLHCFFSHSRLKKELSDRKHLRP